MYIGKNFQKENITNLELIRESKFTPLLLLKVKPRK